MSTEMSAADKMAACAEMAKPAPEHERLHVFEGTFKAKVTFWMDPSAGPMTSTGVMTNRLVLGGKFIEHDYSDDAGMFQGKGFWGYNTIDKRWEGIWIDSMSSMTHIEMGQHDPGSNTWEMLGEMTNPMGAGAVRKRDVITLVDNDHHTMEMHHSSEGGDEFLAMRIEYERA